MQFPESIPVYCLVDRGRVACGRVQVTRDCLFPLLQIMVNRGNTPALSSCRRHLASVTRCRQTCDIASTNQKAPRA